MPRNQLAADHCSVGMAHTDTLCPLNKPLSHVRDGVLVEEPLGLKNDDYPFLYGLGLEQFLVPPNKIQRHSPGNWSKKYSHVPLAIRGFL